MNAPFFRSLAVELAARLSGKRLGKIFSPADGSYTLEVQAPGEKFLLFRPARPAGLLFLCAAKPENPAQAPARAMWLRKRLTGRRLLAMTADWPGLRLAFELSPGEGRFLLLDLRQGLSLEPELPPGFGQEPGWPPLEDILSREDVWKDHPQLSPGLRRRLAGLPREEAEALLAVLAANRLAEFFVHYKQGAAVGLGLWPEVGPGRESRAFPSALDAAGELGRTVLFPRLAREGQAPERAEAGREVKRLRRALDKLDQEEGKLAAMSLLARQAEALRAGLYLLSREAGADRAVVPGPDGTDLEIPLDPALTPAENMAALFARAAKAGRGRPHLVRRRAEISARLAELESGAYEAAPREPAALAGSGGNTSPSGQSRSRSGAPTAPLTVLPKKLAGVAVSLFRSSDGFLLLRGKNREANQKLFAGAAAPFDYWLHAEGGPGAHVILRRDHPGREVPERSLTEAAQLAALKSWKRNDAVCDVICALVKDVRSIKGADQGAASVHKVHRMLRVAVDPEVEARLAVNAGPPEA